MDNQYYRDNIFDGNKNHRTQNEPRRRQRPQSSSNKPSHQPVLREHPGDFQSTQKHSYINKTPDTKALNIINSSDNRPQKSSNPCNLISDSESKKRSAQNINSNFKFEAHISHPIKIPERQYSHNPATRKKTTEFNNTPSAAITNQPQKPNPQSNPSHNKQENPANDLLERIKALNFSKENNETFKSQKPLRSATPSTHGKNMHPASKKPDHAVDSSNINFRLSTDQPKNVYASKEEFKYIFDYLIKLEEQEGSKPVYEDETCFCFISDADVNQLTERFFVFNDLKSVNIIREIGKKLQRMKSPQRKFALFSDYKCAITHENVDRVVVKSDFGQSFEVKVVIFHEFALFEFDEEVPQNVDCFSLFIEESNFERIKEALRTYLVYNVNRDINGVFLGQSIKLRLDFEVKIPDYSANGMLRFNSSQIDAVVKALNYKVSIIQGPPGTGKTQTISSIVYNLNYLCRNSNSSNCNNYDYISNYFTKNSKILICAASNSPVFDLRRKLVDIGINVIQVLARSKEDEYKNDPGTLKYILRERLLHDVNLNNLKLNLNQIRTENPFNPNIPGLSRKIGWMERNIERSIVAEANIICCTTRVLQNAIFKDISFDFVIIDEATQCIEPDIVLCLLKDVKHLILVGDIHQLGPVIKSQKAHELGFGRSTIQRLQGLGVPLSFLDTQYRMYPFLSAFSNTYIYDNKIKNGKTGIGPLIFPKIVKTCGFFYHIQSVEKRFMSSFVNIGEAEVVISAAKYLRSKNIQYTDVGVITFYSGQRRKLRELAKKYYLNGLDVMSVDESQGREKEYIILSCVRSNEYCKVGFLNEYRRLNVSMTRAKSGLIVCGNANNFCKSELWSSLVRHFLDCDAIFTGEFLSLREFKPKLN